MVAVAITVGVQKSEPVTGTVAKKAAARREGTSKAAISRLSYHAFQDNTQGRARCPAKPTVCVQSIVGGGGWLLALEGGQGRGKRVL